MSLSDILKNYFLDNLRRIDLRNPDLEDHDPIKQVLSRVYFRGILKRDALQAACLYGAVVSLQTLIETQEWSEKLHTLFNKLILHLRIGIQHALTRAWIRLPKNLRTILEYSWHSKQPYHDQMEAWMELCVASVRVATVALAFFCITGRWKAYLPTIDEDRRCKLDLVVTGNAKMGTGVVEVGLLLQVKGKRRGTLEDSIHIISNSSNPVPTVIDDDEWASLRSLWDLTLKRYSGNANSILRLLSS